MKDMQIVVWDEKYHDDFIKLSVEWLEKYVSVEPADLEILHYPHQTILNHGGQIFFAIADEVVVGTVAMINNGDGSYELAKLAVTEQYKGQGIGNLLMDSCISYAKEKKGEQILLYTNRKLVPAIKLYEKMGFSEVVLTNNKYLESDMKMVLNLK